MPLKHPSLMPFIKLQVDWGGKFTVIPAFPPDSDYYTICGLGKKGF